MTDTPRPIEQLITRFDAVITRLVSGGPQPGWDDRMARALARHHLVAWLLGTGAPGAVPADVANRVAVQLGYLRRFARETDDMSVPAFVARARQYANPARATYFAAQARKLGLPALPMPAEGTECAGQCRCAWRFDEVTGGYDCYWVRGATDSCTTCIARERRWSPLRVRDGRIA